MGLNEHNINPNFICLLSLLRMLKGLRFHLYNGSGLLNLQIF